MQKRQLLPFVIGALLAVAACERASLSEPQDRHLTATSAKPNKDVDENGVLYECPTNWINGATIPGNIYPNHEVAVGNALYHLPFERIVDYSPTGLEKGKYAIAGGGPYVSKDGKIAVVSGNVTGWCKYTKIAQSGFVNFVGNLNVTEFDGEVIEAPTEQSTEPPPPPANDCDDPYTDESETSCDDTSTGSSGGGVQSTFNAPTSGWGMGSKTVCMVTDWYDNYGHYLGTSIDYCWTEPT